MSSRERSSAKEDEKRGREGEWEIEWQKGTRRETNLNSNENRHTNTQEPISVDVIAFLTAPRFSRILCRRSASYHCNGTSISEYRNKVNDTEPLTGILQNTLASDSHSKALYWRWGHTWSSFTLRRRAYRWYGRHCSFYVKRSIKAAAYSLA